MSDNLSILKTRMFTLLHSKKQMLFLGTILLIIIVAAVYWRYAQRYISTDDAYLNAHVVQIAPRITGQVIHLNVANNQYVPKRYVLFTIDPTPFVVALNRATAQLAIDEAKWKNAQATAERVLTLVKTKAVSQQIADDAVTALHSATAAIQLDKTRIAEAQLNIGYTHVTAPTDGWITNMSLREGNIVQANQPLFAFVSNIKFWVDTNFKETQLAQIKPGQTATIKVDMYPHHLFKGVVESISRGTGAAFSLLPPENATGNWVKVTQRVPVIVVITRPDSRYPLRIGTTATVTIDVHSKKPKS